MASCDGCTLCCKLTNVPYMGAPSGEYCNRCSPGEGCSIYDKAPAHCKKFRCAYIQMLKVNPALRPDRCGILLEKINDSLFLATADGELGHISNLAKGQIQSLNREGFSVMLQQVSPHKFVCFMVAGAKKNEISKALEDKANDCTKLHN